MASAESFPEAIWCASSKPLLSVSDTLPFGLRKYSYDAFSCMKDHQRKTDKGVEPKEPRKSVLRNFLFAYAFSFPCTENRPQPLCVHWTGDRDFSLSFDRA